MLHQQGNHPCLEVLELIAGVAQHYTALWCSSSRCADAAGWSWLACLAWGSSDSFATAEPWRALGCSLKRFYAPVNDHLEAGTTFNFKTNDTTRSDRVGLDQIDFDESTTTAAGYRDPKDHAPYFPVGYGTMRLLTCSHARTNWFGQPVSPRSL